MEALKLGEVSDNIDVSKLTREDINRLVGQKSAKLSYAPNHSGRKRAEAWKKFETIMVDGIPVCFVKCKTCNTVYKSTGTLGTSRLNNHKCSDVTDRRDTNSKAGTTSKFIKGATDQPFMTSFTKKPVATHFIDQLNELIVVGLAKDLRPLRSVESSGFLHIAQVIPIFRQHSSRLQIDTYSFKCHCFIHSGLNRLRRGSWQTGYQRDRST